MRLKKALFVILISVITMYFIISVLTPEQAVNTVNNKSQHLSDLKKMASTPIIKQANPASLASVQQANNNVNRNNKSLWVVTNKKNAKPFPFHNPRKINYHYLKLNRAVISHL